jgi:hypothetical protein
MSRTLKDINAEQNPENCSRSVFVGIAFLCTFTSAHIEPPPVPEGQRKQYFTRQLLNDTNPANGLQNRMMLNQNYQ